MAIVNKTTKPIQVLIYSGQVWEAHELQPDEQTPAALDTYRMIVAQGDTVVQGGNVESAD